MLWTVGWRGSVGGHGGCSVMVLSAPVLVYISIESENSASSSRHQKSSVFVCVCICEFVVYQFQGVFIDSDEGSPAVSTTISTRAIR
jgi:hypothetical protein